MATDDLDTSPLPRTGTRMMGRRMNSQMNVSLPIDLHERLRAIAWEERIPLSHLCRALLAKGLEAWEAEQGGQQPQGEPANGEG